MAITLTTDFGYADPFVGILKGVILGIHAEARIIDLTHGIPAQNILAGALALWSSVHYFPHGTIHVVVVDPGVGSDRRPILLQIDSNYFIGPDNGVLSLVLEHRRPTRIVHLSNDAYHLQPKSRTFHGRDVFAPVAAHLSQGTPPERFGDAINELVRLPWPAPNRKEKVISGEILYIDGFGNLFTNVRGRDLTGFADEEIVIHLGSTEIRGLSLNYSEGQSGNFIALINSWGLLEIALCRGNAAMRSGMSVGDSLEIFSGVNF
jgi:S-adenosyl-L-methionine hydrolase (adenosine-forming)